MNCQSTHMAYEEGSTVSSEEQSSPSLLPEVGNLTLKEGDKIHIDLKGKSTKLKDAKPPAKGSSGSSSGGALPLLKKPPLFPAIPTAQKQEIKTVGGIYLKDAIQMLHQLSVWKELLLV